MYDVIVIGMGPAGMNAALYAKRSGLNVLILEASAPGGLLNKTNKIENYIGINNIAGPDLAFNMFSHVTSLKVEFKIEEVRDIKVLKNYKKVTTTKGVYKAKSIIICSGRQPKQAGIDKEETYVGKGISYCAICDAPLYKGKDVAVVGGGNSAFEESLYLSDIVKKVYIIIRKPEARADKKLIDEVSSRKNIEVIYESLIEELITKDDRLESIKISNGRTLSVSGIFIYTGYEPKTKYLSKLGILREDGYIDVDDKMRTKVKGIYAAGDGVKKELYQVITACSEGAIAAMSVKKDIGEL